MFIEGLHDPDILKSKIKAIDLVKLNKHLFLYFGMAIGSSLLFQKKIMNVSIVKDLEDIVEDQQNTVCTCVIDTITIVQSINMREKRIETCKDLAKKLIRRCRMLKAGTQTCIRHIS